MIRRPPKRNDGRRPRRGLLIAAAGLLVVVALCGGGAWAWQELSDICSESARIEDVESDVSVRVIPGRMVPPEAVMLQFGLTNGACLSRIDLAGLRSKLLAKAAGIRDIKISRRLPNKLSVDVFEREPVARVMGRSPKAAAGRVVDSEGVVFRYSRDVAALPIIREASIPLSKPGDRLKGSAAAALQLVEAASEKPLSALGVQEVDTSRSDYLVVTLGDYSRAKIAWEKMGENTAASRKSLRTMLEKLSQCIATQISAGARLWIATDWKTLRIYAKDPARAGMQVERNR